MQTTRPSPSFPLSGRDRALGRTDALQARIDEAFAPFQTAGVFEPIDVYAADFACRRAGEHRPEVHLALALAVRAPRVGDVCAPLDPSAGATLPTGAAGEALPWPSDLAEWAATVASSPVVAASTERAAFHWHAGRLYTDRCWRAEDTIAAALQRRAAQAPPLPAPHRLAADLDALFGSDGGPRVNRQRLAAAMACLRGLLVLSGGPGTGKTWTVRVILTLMFAQAHAVGAPFPRVLLAAPTGKAAARVREALLSGLDAFCTVHGPVLLGDGGAETLRAAFTQLRATTLHRLLGTRPDNPTRFRHDAGHPLVADLLLIDEVSMVDASMMARLLEATPADCRLLLLGDRDQLPSVDAGAVLSDLGAGLTPTKRVSAPLADALAAAAGMQLRTRGDDSLQVTEQPISALHDATIQLTESRRFGADSGIGRFARAAIAGDADTAEALLRAGVPGSLVARPLTGALDTQALALIIDGVATPEGRRGGLRLYLDRLWAGPTDTETEEEHHRAVLNLFDEVRVLCPMREGARGVSGANQAIAAALAARWPNRGIGGASWPGRPVLITENDPGTGRTNGDVGIFVDRIDERGIVVRAVAFLGPDGVEYLPPARLPPHETVFAMTIHKSQGSEFWHTILILPRSAHRSLSAELLYTGATRARMLLTVLGLSQTAPDPTLAAALGTRTHRHTGLAHRLWATQQSGTPAGSA